MSKINPRGLYWADPDLLAAQSMHACDIALRRADNGRSVEAWLRAGVDFMRAAMRHDCLDRLNELADIYGGNTRLSERSIDVLFESGGDTELFVQRLRLEAERDPEFGEQLRRHFSANFFTRPLELAQPELFA